MVGASERHKLDRAFVEKLQANLEKSSLAFKRDVTRCDILDKVGEYIEPFNQKLALYLEQLEFYRANKYRFEWEIFEKELRSAFTLTRSFQSSISKHNAPDRSVPFDEGLNWTTKTWKAYESVLRDMREDYITDGMMIRVLDSMDRISLAYAKCVNGN
ncbi:hypothetical protein FRC03_009920 [Tulasnella sp. 419]|nr:hypothetical protein FRC03_009920 [Tulasnella sp. 419]